MPFCETRLEGTWPSKTTIQKVRSFWRPVVGKLLHSMGKDFDFTAEWIVVSYLDFMKRKKLLTLTQTWLKEIWKLQITTTFLPTRTQSSGKCLPQFAFASMIIFITLYIFNWYSLLIFVINIYYWILLSISISLPIRTQSSGKHLPRWFLPRSAPGLNLWSLQGNNYITTVKIYKQLYF